MSTPYLAPTYCPPTYVPPSLLGGGPGSPGSPGPYCPPTYAPPSYLPAQLVGGMGGHPASRLTVTVTPATVTVQPGGAVRFAAAVAGAPLGYTDVAWSVASGGGSITPAGLYIAPPVGDASPVVLATSRFDPNAVGTATISVSADVLPPLGPPDPAGGTPYGPGVWGPGVWGPGAWGGDGEYEPDAPSPPDCLIDAAIAWLKSHCPGVASYIGTGLAPAGTPPPSVAPWVTLHEVAEDRDDSTTAGDYIATGLLQVSVFAAGKTRARAVAKQFASALDDAPLMFADGRLMKLRQTGRPVVIQDPTDAARGDNVWQESRTFAYRLSGNYAGGD